MKGLNIKKLAAVGVGAALIGSALAPMAAAIDLQKSDVINASGTPKVDVVAGVGAKVSDWVWAGNIATKVAQLATNVSCSGEGGSVTPDGMTVDVVVGGTTAYSTDSSQTYDSNTLSTYATAAPEFVKTLTDSQLTFLKDETLTYRINSTSYDQRIQEKIGIKADAKFDTQHKTDIDGDLVAFMDNEGDFNYMISIQEGLPVTFTSGDSNKMDLYLFGEKYKVQSVTGASGSYKVTLMKDAAAQTLNH